MFSTRILKRHSTKNTLEHIISNFVQFTRALFFRSLLNKLALVHMKTSLKKERNELHIVHKNFVCFQLNDFKDNCTNLFFNLYIYNFVY